MIYYMEMYEPIINGDEIKFFLRIVGRLSVKYTVMQSYTQKYCFLIFT